MSAKLTKVDEQRFIDNITSITPKALKGGILTVTRHPTQDHILFGGADGVPKIYRMQRVKNVRSVMIQISFGIFRPSKEESFQLIGAATVNS